jgi:tRNA(Leu) C34 or U34 (ribose-2'-O)-methylase TrmL
LISIEETRDFVQNEKYEFYSHAITEAKKDGVEPEDIIYVLLTGKIIERYYKRHRVLVYGAMLNGLPLHVVCDYSDEDIMYIPTVYIPSKKEWTNNYQRRKKGGKR